MVNIRFPIYFTSSVFFKDARYEDIGIYLLGELDKSIDDYLDTIQLRSSHKEVPVRELVGSASLQYWENCSLVSAHWRGFSRGEMDAHRAVGKRFFGSVDELLADRRNVAGQGKFDLIFVSEKIAQMYGDEGQPVLANRYGGVSSEMWNRFMNGDCQVVSSWTGSRKTDPLSYGPTRIVR